MSMIWPDDTARARRSDPLSSHEAADATAGLVQESQSAVLWLFENEERPLNVKQIKDLASQKWPGRFSDSRLQSVPSELERQGLLIRGEVVRLAGDKRSRPLWCLPEVA